jgi:predicted dehydrogenase
VTGAAVIGTGFGGRVHVPALRAAGFEVRALVGRDADRTRRRAARLGIDTTHVALAEALRDDAIDAVTIATPPDTHAELAARACAAGKHVLCEKPFALDVAQARSMFAAAEAAGVTHLLGHEFRWSPERALVARAIAAGMLGEPRTFTLAAYVPLVADPDARMPEWWFDATRGGGWLGASGSHLVDQLRVWLGDVATVSAALPTVSARRSGVEDTFVVRVTMRNGAEGVLQQTAAAWGPDAPGLAVVAGTEGTIEIRAGQVHLSDAAGTRVLPVPEELQLPPAPAGSGDARERFTHLELGPYTRLCEALHAGVKELEPPSAVPVPTFADGLANMAVLDAIRASARAGGQIVAVAG